MAASHRLYSLPYPNRDLGYELVSGVPVGSSIGWQLMRSVNQRNDGLLFVSAREAAHRLTHRAK